MKRITRKSEVRLILEQVITVYKSEGLHALAERLNSDLLDCAVKFPLLEFVAKEVSVIIKPAEHISLANKISDFQKEGGNVILGILMQQYGVVNRLQAFEKAGEYINAGAIWYASDLIGERVFGVALLEEPKLTMHYYKSKAFSTSHWVRRSLGAGGHYAIKKGLEAKYVEPLFLLLLDMSALPKDASVSAKKEIRQGVGWAAKTTAKFHPEIIDKYRKQIENVQKVPNWFRKKIAIGLQRNDYAKGD